MTRDPLLPARLVDGVWTTEGAVEIGGQILHAKVTCTPPPAPETSSVPPTSHEVTIPITVNADDWRESTKPRVAPSFGYNRDAGEITVTFDTEATCPGEAPIPVRAVVTWATRRRIFAALHPRGYLYALGDTEADARENALSRRDINRDEARSVGVDFPPPETDTAWADELIFVTVSGTTESLRVYVASVDDVIPWCPADLWDSGEVTP